MWLIFFKSYVCYIIVTCYEKNKQKRIIVLWWNKLLWDRSFLNGIVKTYFRRIRDPDEHNYWTIGVVSFCIINFIPFQYPNVKRFRYISLLAELTIFGGFEHRQQPDYYSLPCFSKIVPYTELFHSAIREIFMRSDHHLRQECPFRPESVLSSGQRKLRMFRVTEFLTGDFHCVRLLPESKNPKLIFASLQKLRPRGSTI